jgi:hypothetical protein
VQLAIEHLQTMVQDVPTSSIVPYGTVAAIFPYDAVPVMLGRVGAGRSLGALLSGSAFPRKLCAAKIIAECYAPSFSAQFRSDNRDFGAACVADPVVQALFISGGGSGLFYEAQAAAFAKLFLPGPAACRGYHRRRCR